jgi:hypothetical protein
MIALAISPALAPGKAAPYVIAAYVVFLAVILIYVAIMARRLTRTEDDLSRLKRDLDRMGPTGGAPPPGPDPDDTADPDHHPEREQEPVG